MLFMLDHFISFFLFFLLGLNSDKLVLLRINHHDKQYKIHIVLCVNFILVKSLKVNLHSMVLVAVCFINATGHIKIL